MQYINRSRLLWFFVVRNTTRSNSDLYFFFYKWVNSKITHNENVWFNNEKFVLIQIFNTPIIENKLCKYMATVTAAKYM